MKIIRWNSHWLGNLRGIRGLRDLVKKEATKFLFSIKTKLKLIKVERIRFQLGYDCCFVVLSEGSSRDLNLMWKNEVPLAIRNFLRYHIVARVGGWRCR